MAGKGDLELISAEMLAQQGAMHGVDPLDIAELRQNAQLRRLPPGAALLQRGEPNANMYVVLAGVLRVDLDQGDEEPIARVRPPGTVGELSLLARSTATAWVTAEEETELLVVDEATFSWLVGRSHAFALNLLVTLAQRLQSSNSVALSNLFLRRHFERAALHDALTGLNNRRWLDETLPRLMQRHRFAGQTMCVAVMDIDHFKRINDRFGHPAGDAVLAAIADTVRKNLRPTDMFARIGGEEFVLIFPQTALAGAVIAAERLRTAVASQALSHQGNALPQTTASFGIAELATEGDCNSLLQRADTALYRAKELGRNQTQVAG